MAELFKFRCPECSKLLGVSFKKVGRSVQCPQCRTELIVPSPDDQQADELEGEASDFAQLGIELGSTLRGGLRPTDQSQSNPPDRPPNEVETLAFLGKIEQSGLQTPPDPILLDQLSDAADAGDQIANDLEAEPLVATPVEPLTTRRRASNSTVASFDRRRDVVLPRTALIAWSLFALIALALSFLAGLLLGHYHWK